MAIPTPENNHIAPENGHPEAKSAVKKISIAIETA